MPGTASPDPAVTRALAAFGLVGVGVAVVLVGLLHVVSAGRVNPVRRTISEYALGDSDWMFDVGVLGLAGGSVLVLLALVRAGIVQLWSRPAALVGVWAAALVLIVAFDKANWAVGPTPSGYVHRYASVVAFVSLPAAALALGRRWRGDLQWGPFAACSRWSGALALLWLGAIVLAVALSPLTGVPWWQLLPLGLVERGLLTTEVATVVVLGWWAARAASAPRPAAMIAG
ncbi:DUF998 domain-containing protein [Pseudonocardia xinjiangensis]|uniref:DUF998 domain-containing protein n=1 Tax=Pseudonocardia xinjiangensis TaxID=75289 RepID=A0ABX1RSW5_9PSEU|nr:DUF998 domain-containing protein [Pseudonocardia xinjiangensis]NMH82709.1 DUF998 domain-containing protein [Pseudonocardia xinjiangensis]